MRKGFWTEAAVVGASTVVIGGVIDFALKSAGYGSKGLGYQEAEKKFHWIPVAFATGVLTHIAWEAVGGNEWFAKNYAKTVDSSKALEGA